MQMTSFKKAVQKANRFLAESGSKTIDSAKNRFYSLTFSTELKDSMWKLIIFDFDGTISDTTELIVNTMQATLKELGLPLYSREECASKIGLPLREMFVSLMDESVADKCEATYRKMQATDALVVGDTPYDVLMGKGAGTSTCAVTYGNGTIEEFRIVSPDYIIDDFSKIINL